MFNTIVIYLRQGCFIQECDFGVSLETIRDRDVQKNDTPIVTCISSLSFIEFIFVCPPATATLLSICAQGFEGRHFMNWFVLASVTGNYGLWLLVFVVFGGLCPGSWLMGWPEPIRTGCAPSLNKVHAFVRLSWFGFLFGVAWALRVCLQAAWCHKAT